MDFRLRTEIGELLRLRRRAARLSQEALARSAGISQSEVSKLERGTNSARVDLVERVFAALGLQIRVGVERVGAHLDDEIERLLIQSPEERLLGWDWTLRQLSSIDIVFEGALAALLQGVPVPVDAADIAITRDGLDGLAAWLNRYGAIRWSERLQQFWGMNSDPSEPGALYWHLQLGDVRARICRRLPDWIHVSRGDTAHRVRPLDQLELTDPLHAAVMRRFRQRGSDEEG